MAEALADPTPGKLGTRESAELNPSSNTEWKAGEHLTDTGWGSRPLSEDLIYH